MFAFLSIFSLEFLLLFITQYSYPIALLFLALPHKIWGKIQVALSIEIEVPQAVIFDQGTEK